MKRIDGKPHNLWLDDVTWGWLGTQRRSASDIVREFVRREIAKETKRADK